MTTHRYRGRDGHSGGAVGSRSCSQEEARAAAEQAKADLAPKLAEAQLYADNPAYLTLQTALANASAFKATDKIVFTPIGSTPTIIVPGPGVQPTVNAGPQ